VGRVRTAWWGVSGGGGFSLVDAGITKLRCCLELAVGTWVVTFCIYGGQQHYTPCKISFLIKPQFIALNLVEYKDLFCVRCECVSV
jgi:hypothetical protein